MSDLIYSSKNIEPVKLSSALNRIYNNVPINSHTFRGRWGTIAISKNHYRGYNPYETEQHIVAVTGGPLLRFNKNNKYTGDNSATKLIYERWMRQGYIRWDNELSGSFAIILIDKQTYAITIITDMLSSIPVYHHQTYETSNRIDTIGTHVDTVASICGAYEQFDPTSLADLLLNRTIVYPYSPYRNVRQLPPAHQITIDKRKNEPFIKLPYWEPVESFPFSSINEAAEEVRYKLKEEIESICGGSEHIAVLLSGGEDSRTILGAIPEDTKVTSISIAEKYNLETKLATLTARSYESNLEIAYRPAEHFIDYLEERAHLTGTQHECIHSHTYGIVDRYHLNTYDAVIGGYSADALLKGDTLTPKFKIAGLSLFFDDKALQPDNVITNRKLAQAVGKSTLHALVHRYENHLRRLASLRDNSYAEWMWIYPMTMRKSAGHFICNRRLFRTYEPFMGSDIIKLSAVIPQRWKTNRKLFQRSVFSFLSPSWYIPHVMGHLPYFKTSTNIFPRLLFRLPIEILHLTGIRSRNEHLLTPDWELLHDYSGLHDKWEQYKYIAGNCVSDIFTSADFLDNNDLPTVTKTSLIQIAANISHFHNFRT